MDNLKRKGLSAAVMKNTALITMTIDHITAIWLKMYLNSHGVFQIYSNPWYLAGRIIGRIAFVLYAFMIAEGAIKTKNRMKYALRLLILALVSVVPHGMAHSKKLIELSSLNIFFLLLTGLLTIYAYQWIREKVPQRALSVILRILAVIAACAVSVLCNFEYGLMGILLIMVFYIFRYDTPKMMFWGFIVMSLGYMLNVIVNYGVVRWIHANSGDIINGLINADKIQIFGLLAFPIIILYNGEKGRQLPKMIYYLYYPVHLAILALIKFLY